MSVEPEQSKEILAAIVLTCGIGMFDSNLIADLTPESSNMGSSDLNQRLGLYRVFLKLYEHHRELLDEILDLENTGDRSRGRGVWQYVQGVVEGENVYLTTNLIQDKSQLLMQSQQTWIIGRDRKAGISVQDKRLSRRHAMIQYAENQGFFLVDLNSTNGTYLNGEAIRRPVLLKDGDRIRLGSVSVIFFLCSTVRTLEATPADLLSQLNDTPNTSDSESPLRSEDALPAEWDEPLPGSEKETSMFLKPSALNKEPVPVESDTSDLSTDQKADILDRFLNR